MFRRPDVFRKTSTSTHTDISAIRAALANADPAGGELDTTAAARLASMRHAITSQATASPGSLRAALRPRKFQPGRGRRRAVVISLAIPVLLAASAAGWEMAGTQTASHVTDGIGCYAAASLHASTTVVVATGQDPASVCARYWSDGVVSGKPGNHVPALVACVLPDGGAVGVFPDTSCSALGLQPIPRGYRQAARRFGALTAALRVRFGASRCVYEKVAVADVRQALRRHGFSGWRVVGYQPMPHSINGPCATFIAQTRTHTVTVVPRAGQGVESVSVPALNKPSSECTPGHAPENPRTVTRQIQAALRAAGYGQWKVVIVNPASTAQPCYSPGYDPARHEVTLSSYAGLTAP
jgi:hypothetical protein